MAWPKGAEESFLAIVAARRVVVQRCFALHTVRVVCEPRACCLYTQEDELQTYVCRWNNLINRYAHS